MKESYGEVIANHTGPEPYAESGDTLGVASGKGTGRPAIELRNQVFRASTSYCQGEDNMHVAAMARQQAARRSRRP
jgi:hypothetical protein